MQMKTVKQHAKNAGIGLEGVKLKISRDPDLIGRNLFGYANPKGNRITLYPDAFSSSENLIRTLGHERTHLYQFKTFGAPTNSVQGRLFEEAAYGIEDSFVQYWKFKGGK